MIRLDVILHPYQLYQTRASGGDGAVIFPELLSPLQLQDLLGLGEELRLWIGAALRQDDGLHRVLAHGGRDALLLGGDPFSRGPAASLETLATRARAAARWLRPPGELLVWGGGLTSAGLEKLGEAGATGALVPPGSRPHLRGRGPT